MKKSGFAFVIFFFLLASCNDGALEVEIKVKNFGCSDNASLANKKPSFEFTLTEKKGQCDASCILYVDTVDHSHNRKQHMGSVDVYKDSFQLYVLQTTTETKCHHWAEADMNVLNQSVEWGMSNPCNPCTCFLVFCS